MKKLILYMCFSFAFVYSNIRGAGILPDSTTSAPYTVEISIWKPLAFGGFTQVREWDNVGPKYHLNEDLGMNNLEGVDFILKIPVAEKHELNFIIGRYFFTGSQLLTQNGYYNGTELKENNVASIDASRYIRIMLLDYLTLSKSEKDLLRLEFGISIDAIRFLVDAPYTENTPRKETFEQFDKQLVPVPIAGINWKKNLDDETKFNLDVRGGAWPGIDTWYKESGTIKIWQYNLEAEAGISKRFGSIESELNFNFRMISLKGESLEDTNEILIHGFGPELKILYHF